MNRDYFSRPIQGGGRDSHDYGRSGHIQSEQRDPWLRPTIAFAGLIVAYFIWQYLRH